MASSEGEWLEAYELGKQLETNALTTTFVAERRNDQRRVLIKTVKPGLRTTDHALAVLGREREVVEAAQHPTLPSLLETVRAPHRMALVYAHAEGHRLSDVLDRVPRIRAAPTLAIATALAGALGALHRAGYVHARLRVESIELSESGAVILHDPGGVGARGVGGDPELEAPENMAPEQVLGQAAGPETDVYLLGKLIYRLITGTAAFVPGTGGITQQIRHADPAPMHASAPDSPRELQRIVARCLRKRGRDRYPDMASLQSELLRVMHAQTSLSAEHLVTMALADAGLADNLPPPRERGVDRGATTAPPWVMTALKWLLVAAGAGAVVALGWTLFGDSASSNGHDARGIVKRPALVRVLAQPWAEVHIDGELVDVTPVGQPIEVAPGHHVVVFKHPNSESVERTIDITAGQMILLDVEMPVVRPPTVDAGVEDASDASTYSFDAGPPPED